MDTLSRMAASLEVCLCSYGSGHDLERAVSSIAAAIGARGATTVSVAIQENSADTTSLERMQTVCAALQLPVRTRHDPSNPGFGAACNALASEATADWLLFLNPDCRIVEWSFALDSLDRHSLFGPAHITGRRAAAHRGHRFGVRDEVAASWLRRHGAPQAGAGFVSGAALLVSRTAHLQIGGFDERYFLFYEDIDYCLRANARGINTRLLVGWSVDHAGAHSTRARFADSLVWSYESGCRFHIEHGHSIRAYRVYVACDSALRAVYQWVSRDRSKRRAYQVLAGRAIRELVRG